MDFGVSLLMGHFEWLCARVHQASPHLGPLGHLCTHGLGDFQAHIGLWGVQAPMVFGVSLHKGPSDGLHDQDHYGISIPSSLEHFLSQDLWSISAPQTFGVSLEHFHIQNFWDVSELRAFGAFLHPKLWGYLIPRVSGASLYLKFLGCLTHRVSGLYPHTKLLACVCPWSISHPKLLGSSHPTPKISEPHNQEDPDPSPPQGWLTIPCHHLPVPPTTPKTRFCFSFHPGRT